jgi:hypothetical protein
MNQPRFFGLPDPLGLFDFFFSPPIDKPLQLGPINAGPVSASTKRDFPSIDNLDQDGRQDFFSFAVRDPGAKAGRSHFALEF